MQPRHVLVVVSQMGVDAGQSVLAAHCTHLPALPPDVSQMGVGVVQSDATQARHVFVVVSQMGVPPEHWELLVHATQAPVCVLHSEPAGLPAHCVLEVQPTHVPVLHTGVGLLHWEFVVHAGAVPCHSQSGPPEPALL